MDQSFGEHLRAMRKRRLLTQGELAERIGVDWRVIQRWEAGGRYPRPVNLRLLASALSLSPEELLNIS